VASREKLGKNPREQLNFTGSTHNLVVDKIARVELVLDILKQEWVLADLAELHELVAQAFDTAPFPINGACSE
jgi:hypothetical protein